jgi:NAD(P)-dependent dehydrogenase (short-subunit alcohol dehydrogenase family)
MKILVTGGASGLGEAITRVCAAVADNQVYFTYHSSVENAARLEAEYLNVKSIACDFTSDLDVDNLKERLTKLDIDVLVNNVYTGAFIKTYFHKTESREFLDEFKANILPTVAVTQAAIQCFRKKKHGKIITILTSALISAPPIGAGVYVANKAYLAALSKVWATENAKFNITANTISPAFMLTAFTSGVDERMVERMQESHPLKQLLTTSEAAEAVAFLCTASRQINGIDIPVNSALNMR